jgi:hypothetical protein
MHFSSGCLGLVPSSFLGSLQGAVRRRWQTLLVVVAGAASTLLAGSAAAFAPEPLTSDYIQSKQNLFRPNELLHVKITLDSNPTGDPNTAWDCNSDIPLTATIRLHNSVMDVTMTTVSVRNRGNTSRCNNTRSWEVNIDEFVPGRELFGVDQLQFNGEPNDPSSARSFFAWRLFNKMGVPSSRAAATSLTVNGSFYGFHNLIESSDKGFMGDWFGDSNGIRFKCVSAQADLAWRGSNRGAYDGNTNLGDGAQGYELQSTNLEGDYAALIGFIDFINNSSNAQFAAGIEGRFDVDSFLRFLAVNVTIGSWDDYWYGSNNYGLYLPPGSTRWQWIPYDFDNTFGVDFFGVNWATRPVNSSWKSGGFGTGNSPLVDRLLAIPAYEQQYRRYIHRLRQTEFSTSTLHAAMDSHLALTLTALQLDTRDAFSSSTNANSYSSPSSYSGGASTPAKWGLKPFVTARGSYVATNVAIPPSLPPLFVNEVMSANSATITDEGGQYDDWVEIHNAGATTVSLAGMHLTDDFTSPTKWQFPAGTQIGPGGKLLIWCDGQTTQGPLHTSFALSAQGEGVGLFHDLANNTVMIDGYGFPPLLPNRSYGRYPDGGTTLMEFYVPTPNAPNNNTPVPPPGTQPRLFINEFMASNSGIVRDEFNQADDWFEIYNDEPVALNLGGFHVTDNLSQPTKYVIPSGVIIPAKGFLVFWADNTPAQGPLHTNFALAAGGESLGIYGTAADGYPQIDALSFGPMTANETRGRLPDGVGPPTSPLNPTLGGSNIIVPVTLTNWEAE